MQTLQTSPTPIRPSGMQVTHTCGNARAGVLTTHHNTIETPVFMPVGTRATVKTLSQHDLEELGAKIILSNTYHLWQRPGHEVIEKSSGDLHHFMGWKGSILTDSGGFQIFSLKGLRKLSQKGVEFQSHIDGKKCLLTPESCMEIQRALGPDIVMVLDECPALPASKETLRKSLELTYDWAKRCLDSPLRDYQMRFGILQGGTDLELRQECWDTMRELPFDGWAIGGLSVGEEALHRTAVLEHLTPQMDPKRPRYLMGVGTPLDLLEAIEHGVDMFDCVLPTRNARNGQAITSQGPINLKNARFQLDQTPIDPDCACKVCKRYSRAYLRHLCTVGEYLGGQLLSYHNIAFYLNLMKETRASIVAGSFREFSKNFREKYLQNRPIEHIKRI